ncbi:hypothetical protein JQX13_15445 [Archangium violaceum]|uniref:lanthionine synthetase LanC family protein n=1 Tax=Archangium violaceum TaxID=83451 RepID=UPI00193B5217|nr:lanthionine synthetase LanC family protein [Archangium violaceum]QRK11340.1 hypothetical protein JQX13_15445 [Archangium violaceum]
MVPIGGEQFPGDGAWRPLLEGQARQSATTLLRSLAEALRSPSSHPTPSLGSGSAGAALCLAYVGTAIGEEPLVDDAVTLLSSAIEQAGARQMSPAFAEGLAGVGWAIEHLRKELGWGDGDDPNEMLDDVLLRHVSRDAWLQPWGHLEGLTGVGAYFLERLPSPRARAGLERIVLHLLEGAWSTQGLGRTWWTMRQLLPEPLRSRHRFGHYDLGVAHGVPGILGFLGQVSAAGIARPESQGVASKAMEWLWSRRTSEEPSRFPAYDGSEVPHPPAPEGWEHGAIGLGSALLVTADALGDTGRASSLLSWLRATALANTEISGDDVGLRRGAAGLGHLYNRLHQRTGEAVFAERARAWLLHAMERAARQTRLGLLDGAAGTALALLAATSSQAPAWDRLLLLSTRGSP